MKLLNIKKFTLSFILLSSIIITNLSFASILPRTELNFSYQFFEGFISQLRLIFFGL